jgi:hypothetical protein
MNYIRGDLDLAHRLEFFIERLNREQFDAVEVRIFERADGGTEDATE